MVSSATSRSKSAGNGSCAGKRLRSGVGAHRRPHTEAGNGSGAASTGNALTQRIGMGNLTEAMPMPPVCDCLNYASAGLPRPGASPVA